MSASGGDGAPEGGTALARRFPALAARLPRVPLTMLPTPVERLAGLETGAAGIWVKRDDRTAALYGGNKPRKLELVLGAARARGARSVLTFGAFGTHHGLATTVFARAAGLRTILVLVPQPVTAAVRQTLLLTHAFGAELHRARGPAGAAATALALLARGAAAGARPFVVPAGGSSVAGTLGFVDAGLELAEQVRAGALPAPDAVFAPLGTGGTVAGLALGLRLGDLATPVVGVLVTDILPPSRARVLGLARRALARMRRLDPAVPALALDDAGLAVDTRFVGPGYGVPTPAALRARDLLAAHGNVALETTYTAKALAALLVHAETPAGRGRRLLFWNTYAGRLPPPPGGELPHPAELPRAFASVFTA